MAMVPKRHAMLINSRRYSAGLWSGDIPSTFSELAIQVLDEKNNVALVPGQSAARGDDEWGGALDY